jgi:hypothetical protein
LTGIGSRVPQIPADRQRLPRPTRVIAGTSKLALASAAGTVAAPAVVRTQTTFTWKMTSFYGPNAASYSTGPGSAKDLVKRIDDMSGGRPKIHFYGAGELIPAAEGFDAVSSGTVEISYIAVPLFLPVLIAANVDMIWLSTLICLNLPTSFLTPPFGWSLFFLRGVAPPDVTTADMYRGVIPFIGLQLLALVTVFAFPDIALWLPRAIGW